MIYVYIIGAWLISSLFFSVLVGKWLKRNDMRAQRAFTDWERWQSNRDKQ